MVTKAQVEHTQRQWAKGLVEIGSLTANRPACESFADKFLDARGKQGYCHGALLFYGLPGQ